VITGEIARGGMGVVLTAREVALGRDVAIKMLAPGARGAERAVYRFVEEARITARLQHPGIPPIYQVGALADGRPYLSMKLIRGRTLGAILTAREQRPSSRSADELDLTALDSPGLLQIFEQICQAVGYAHARGVVHRDLKPANVMVGSFGEVQVMDWGLAKARGPNGAVACAADGATATADATPPDAFSAPNAEATLVGHAMGTPQYMPPEQACGAWERVDARADVFALGGILTAILTGLPPYTDPTREAVLRRAVACDLAGCIARLDECGADADLIDLAKWCLAPDPDDRPADGAEVARQVAAYRLSVGARLIAAETDRAAAAARAEEARLRAATERLAKRAAEERSVLAEWFADEVRTRAGETARRRRGVFVAVVFVLLVLSGLYGDYRERKGRAAVAPPPPPPACGAAGCGAGHE
jgi:serine/threonine protein kinase